MYRIKVTRLVLEHILSQEPTNPNHKINLTFDDSGIEHIGGDSDGI